MAQNKIFRMKADILPKSCPRPRVVRGRAYMPKHYKQWQEEFKVHIEENWDNKMKRNKNTYTTDFYLFLKVHHSHHNVGDVDNIAKSVLDTMQDCILTDDELCKGLFMTQFVNCDDNLIELRVVTVDRWKELTRQTHLNWFDWLNLEPSSV